MSRKELGTDWFCDLCGAKAHTDGVRPLNWQIVLLTIFPDAANERVDQAQVCADCWPIPQGLEPRKSWLQNALAKFKRKPNV